MSLGCWVAKGATLGLGWKLLRCGSTLGPTGLPSDGYSRAADWLLQARRPPLTWMSPRCALVTAGHGPALPTMDAPVRVTGHLRPTGLPGCPTAGLRSGWLLPCAHRARPQPGPVGGLSLVGGYAARPRGLAGLRHQRPWKGEWCVHRKLEHCLSP